VSDHGLFPAHASKAAPFSIPYTNMIHFTGVSGAGAQDFTKMGVQETMKLYYGKLFKILLATGPTNIPKRCN
jgi:hypothetical protein